MTKQEFVAALDEISALIDVANSEQNASLSEMLTTIDALKIEVAQMRADAKDTPS